MGFFSSIGGFFSSVGHTIGNAFGHAYQSAKDVVSGTAGFISKQADHAYNTVNHVVQEAGNLANKAIDTGKNVIEHTEDKVSSTIEFPLILIAAGIGLMLFTKGDRVIAESVKAAKYM